jgi:hypothetical protein
MAKFPISNLTHLSPSHHSGSYLGRQVETVSASTINCRRYFQLAEVLWVGNHGDTQNNHSRVSGRKAEANRGGSDKFQRKPSPHELLGIKRKPTSSGALMVSLEPPFLNIRLTLNSYPQERKRAFSTNVYLLFAFFTAFLRHRQSPTPPYALQKQVDNWIDGRETANPNRKIPPRIAFGLTEVHFLRWTTPR